MKNQLIYLGIAVLTATIASAATCSVKGVTTTNAIATSAKAEQYQISLSENDLTVQKNFSPVEDKTILNPENVIRANAVSIEDIISENNRVIESAITYDGSLLFIEKTVEDIIAEDNKIIESTLSLETHPLLFERTIEDVIDENNRIIDSHSTEFQPLDFKAIKGSTKKENKILIGMN